MGQAANEETLLIKMSRDTIKLPSMDAPKKESNKTLLLTLITGVVSLATAVSVAIINKDSASDEDLAALSKQKDTSFNLVITQINDIILPRIEKNQDAQAAKIDKLIEERAYLLERLVRVEERCGVRGGSALGRMFKPPAMFSGNEDAEGAKPDKSEDKSKKENRKIPRILVQQRIMP